MKLNSVRIISVMVILLAFTSIGGANPGGVGDGNFDMQCGGACHGDASQNQTSPAALELSLDSTAYLNLPVSITAKVSGIQFTSSDKVGLFLITDTTGHSDLPEDAGWTVISDQNGGNNNYVELSGSSLTSEYTASWTLKSDNLQPTEFYLSIHHGDENTPFFGISSALTITPQEVPDNLPRLAADYSPIISRDLGENTTMLISTIDVQQMTVEWRLVEGESVFVNASLVGEQEWSYELPAALQTSVIEWRAVLQGEGPDQTTPWFRIAAQEPALQIDQVQIYLQSIALGCFLMGLILTLHNKFYLPTINDESSIGLVSDGEINSAEMLPLPEGGLPEGWTLEQWKWYGHEYLEDIK